MPGSAKARAAASEQRHCSSGISGQPYWEALEKYLIRDVEVLREAWRRMRPLIPAEQERWRLDQIINNRGVYTRGDFLEAAAVIVKAAKAALQEELRTLTNGEVETTNKLSDLQKWLAKRGCQVPNCREETLAQALLREDLHPDGRRAIEIRLDAAHNPADKVFALLAWRHIDGRLRGTLEFHGASTGRWAGRGPQLQNIHKETEDTAARVAAILTGDITAVSKFGPPLQVIGECLRAAICAAPGHHLLIGDFSGIESRVAAWLASEPGKLALWAKFDLTQSDDDHPYLTLGRATGVPEGAARDLGKTLDLAFQFGGGIGAFRNAAKGTMATDAEIKAFQQAWRAKHPRIFRFWYQLGDAAVSAVRRAPQQITCGRLSLSCELLGNLPCLFVKLFSGRSIAYPGAKLIKDERGRDAVSFMDNFKGRWVEYTRGKSKKPGAWGGIFFQHAVQAIAGDVLFAAIARLEAASYQTILSIHDEIVVEQPDCQGSLEEFERLIQEVPPWAS